MNWTPPRLRQVVVERTAPVVVDDPARFLRDSLAEDAIAVVERAAEVLVVPLADAVFDAATLHVQAFSGSRQAQGRVARSDGVWIGDSIRERQNSGVDEGVQAWARAGRHLCLGKAVAEGSETVMREARIRPYRLPIPIVEGQPAEVEFVDYYVLDAATGGMDCIGHRVVAIRALKGA